MTIYINLIDKKELLELLFPYADKVFQKLFNDYDIIVNSFIKLEKDNLERMVWQFNDVEVSFEVIQSRIKNLVPPNIGCVVVENYSFIGDWKEVK